MGNSTPSDINEAIVVNLQLSDPRQLYKSPTDSGPGMFEVCCELRDRLSCSIEDEP